MTATWNTRILTDRAPAFFRDLRDDLAQGDIIADVPRGFVDDTAVCRVDQGRDYGRAKFLPADQHTSPKAHERKNADDAIHLKVKLGFAMVLWPDCQIDGFANKAREGTNNVKADKMFAGVAPLIDLNLYKESEHDRIKAGNRAALFYVPGFDDLNIPESVVDLRRILPVKQSLLLAGRVASVTDTVRDAMGPHLSWFFTELRHGLGERVGCPSCGSALDLRGLIALPPDSSETEAAS